MTRLRKAAGPYRIAPQETAAIDGAVCRDHYERLGEEMADELIATALEALLESRDVVIRSHRACEFDKLGDEAERVATVALSVGLMGAANAAAGVIGAVAGRQGAAIAATVHRLVRLIDLSVSEVWSARHLDA